MPKNYKLKNKKSVVKRFLKRRSGKVQKRKEGHGHYNANESSLNKSRKKGLSTLKKGEAKNIVKQIPGK